MLKSRGLKKAKPAPLVNHNYKDPSSFKERSSSLKPQKLELKPYSKNPNHSEMLQNHFSFKPSGLETSKANMSYCMPPKHPIRDSLLHSKENIHPNITSEHQNTSISYKERPTSARGPNFEFNQPSEPKRHKQKSTTRGQKFKVNTDNEIKIIDKSDLPSPFIPKEMLSDPSISHLNGETEELLKLKAQNKELRMMVSNLSQTVNLLASELHKHMAGTNQAYNELATKNTLLESKVKYLEKVLSQMQNN